MRIHALWLVALLAVGGCGDDDDDTGPDGDADADTDGDTDADGDTDGDTDADGDGDVEPPPRPAEPEMWLYTMFNMQVNENVAVVEGLMDRAAAAGYTGLVLADFKIGILHEGIVAEWYRPNVASILAYADGLGLEVVPAIYPFGYSDAILATDHNRAEGRPVIGARFVVEAGGRLAFVPSFTGPTNGGFEQHTGDAFDGWAWNDPRVFADTGVAHSGSVSARIEPGEGENARVMQELALTAHRQYHGSFWLRTEGATGGYLQVRVLDAVSGRSRNFNEITAAETQDWTRYDFTFDTGDSTTVNLYVGDWGGPSAGRLWFDDVTIEETALVNLIRREGAPLVARDAGGGELVEGTDIGAVADPHVADAWFDDWHDPPVVTVPGGSRLAAGDEVTIDHYVVAPVAGGQVGACLTDPSIDDYMVDNIAAVNETFPATSGFFLEYDEMRHLHTCASCVARGLGAGGLLAWHVGHATDIIRAVRPDATLYAWSDMFDPNHNAHADYYLAEGDIAGSWEGLSADVVVMNWNLGNADSLAFFANRGHGQIIAGYYDSGDGAASAASELAAATDVEGSIQGLMYTTWRSDFGELEDYAEGARNVW